MENKISIAGGPTLFDDNQDWTNPLIGVRWMWGLLMADHSSHEVILVDLVLDQIFHGIPLG
jgi:hypothetical protein